MTKRGGRGPGRSCSFAFFCVRVCTAWFVLPPDISTHLAAELHFPNLLFFLSVFQFSPAVRLLSHHTSSSRPPAPPPFLPTKPAPSLHLIPPLLFNPPHTPLHLCQPLFFSPSLLPASLKDFFAFSALCLSRSRSVLV